MRNMAIYVILVLLCTIVFTGQSADIPQKDEPSLRDLLGVDIPQQPAPEKQKPKFMVEVLVECDDKNTEAFIESHIKRELRGLRDVEIVDYGKYVLSIVAMENVYKSGEKVGSIALAYNSERRYIPAVLKIMLMDAYPEGTIGHEIVTDILPELRILYDKTRLGLAIGMTYDLDKLCKDIVVNFDAKMLEPDRNGK